MGNKSSHEHNLLTRNWIRIAPSFLRNTLTNQLIQEHDLRFDTYDQQSDFVALLNKRMAHHHPHVVKVIYFKIQTQNCHCSLNGKRYSVLLYTEYQGPSLATQIQSKTVQHTFTCNCLNIITVLQNMQDTYGSFEINEQLMFMNLRPDQYPGEKTFKLWINSKVEECRRERLCNQTQMCLSAVKILKLLGDHGQCKVMQNHQLSDLQGANTLSKVRQELLKLHNKRKKINSFNVHNSRLYGHNSILSEMGQENKRNASIKANSMPQKIEMVLTPRFQNTPQIVQRFVEKGLRDEENQTVFKGTRNDFALALNHRTLYGKNINSSVKPYSAAKINFSYSKNVPNNQKNVYALSGNGIGSILKPTVNLKNHQPPPKPIYGSPRIGNNNQKGASPSFYFENIQPIAVVNERKENEIKNIFSPPIANFMSSQPESSEKTVHSSPFQSEKEYLMNQANKDMDIALDEIKQSPGTAKNPTTSRTPNQPKEHLQIENVHEIQKQASKQQKKTVPSANANVSKKDEKNSSLTSSGNKFQKYSQALKDYQQKIKRKNNNRQHRRDKIPMKIDKKINKLVVPSSKQSQFKETHSIYNQSVEDVDQKPRKEKPSQFKKESKSKSEEEQSVREKERESIQNQEEKLRKADQEKEIQDKKEKRKEEQRLKQQEEDQQIARQKLQKQELQRDLEKEKKLIQNEMEDLLRHNTMKEEYRSIREKVKQKKQTFAELKAEAAKILQDLSF